MSLTEVGGCEGNHREEQRDGVEEEKFTLAFGFEVPLSHSRGDL